MVTLNTTPNTRSSFAKLCIVSALVVGLSACSDNDNDPVVEPPAPTPTPAPAEYSYDVSITNLTNGQPLSPLAVTLHGDSKMWMLGEMASEAIEKIAEGGDSADLMAMSDTLASASATDAVAPGGSTTVSVATTDRMATHLTTITMLVNTNDAFAGLTGVDVSMMAVDQSMSWSLNVYDAGTEANSEALGTMPGPADGGTGFDAARDDVDFIGYHSGVVSQDDGLSTSVLTQAHRFDNPAIKLTITRTK